MKTTIIANGYRKILFTKNGIIVKYDNSYMEVYNENICK